MTSAYLVSSLYYAQRVREINDEPIHTYALSFLRKFTSAYEKNCVFGRMWRRSSRNSPLRHIHFNFFPAALSVISLLRAMGCNLIIALQREGKWKIQPSSQLRAECGGGNADFSARHLAAPEKYTRGVFLKWFER